MKIDINEGPKQLFCSLEVGDVFSITKHLVYNDEYCDGPYMKCSVESQASCVNLRNGFAFDWNHVFSGSSTEVRKLKVKLVSDTD